MKIARVGVGLFALPFCLFLSCPRAAARRSPAQKWTKDSKARVAKKRLKGFLGLVPTYDVANGENLAPMTSKQKFLMAVDDSANSFEVIEAAIKAEYYRGTTPPKKIGYGGTGYLKQWGASYLDEISGSMFHTFVYPTLLHQDPRYRRKGEGSIAGRVVYSLSRVFVTRGDRGRREFNASMVLGSASSTALSNFYYPPKSHLAVLSVSDLGWSLVGDGVGNLFKEFWPDIERRMSKNH